MYIRNKMATTFVEAEIHEIVVFRNYRGLASVQEYVHYTPSAE